MPDTDTRSRLQAALANACAFAKAHGVETPIAPEDFGIQRSSAGWQHATFVDSKHVVSVTLTPDGDAIPRVAELWWIPEPDDRPRVDVYLPGDAPAEAVAHG